MRTIALAVAACALRPGRAGHASKPAPAALPDWTRVQMVGPTVFDRRSVQPQNGRACDPGVREFPRTPTSTKRSIARTSSASRPARFPIRSPRARRVAAGVHRELVHVRHVHAARTRAALRRPEIRIGKRAGLDALDVLAIDRFVLVGVRRKFTDAGIAGAAVLRLAPRRGRTPSGRPSATRRSIGKRRRGGVCWPVPRRPPAASAHAATARAIVLHGCGPLRADGGGSGSGFEVRGSCVRGSGSRFVIGSWQSPA